MFKLLFSPEGRITRSNFWLGIVIGVVACVALSLLGRMYLVSVAGLSPTEQSTQLLSLLPAVPFWWSQIAVGAKRCHDRDRSGWFQLISLIPFVGIIWLLVELGFLRGTVGPNSFGADPLPPVSLSVA